MDFEEIKQAKPSQKFTLVICVDRDNDIGIKAGIIGPIIGRKANLDAATRLALKDPADSDVNAVFQAVKTYDELRLKTRAEVITLTGDLDIGLTSDKKLIRQLEKVLKKYHATEAILVSDGAEDEYIIPLLRSKIRLIYPKRVIVKQSRQLEGAYYVAYDFFKSIISQPKLSRLFMGVPAIMLIIYAFLGSAGWRLIFGLTGLYLLVKGFQLEPYAEGLIKELQSTLHMRKMMFFFYLAAFAIVAVGLVMGYNTVERLPQGDTLVLSALFVHNSIFIMFIGFAVAQFGRMLLGQDKSIPKNITYFVFGFSFSWTVYVLTDFIILNQIIWSQLIYPIVVSAVLISLALLFEKLTTRRKT